MTVEFQGRERTLAQMSPFLEETDRNIRQQAWELVCEPSAEPTGTPSTPCSTGCATLRSQIAREAGFDGYTDLRLPQPRTVRLRPGERGSVPRRHRTRRRPAGPGDSGAADARHGPGGASAPGTWPSTRWDGHRCGRSRTPTSSPRDACDLRPGRPGARRPVRLPPRARPARPGQPQGQGPGRVSDDPGRRSACRSSS